ncbi:hypothetical protein [Bacteroides helcogenes]|uniref:Transglutaminase domain-containing protein n=1 Tax=Bacteroides helcogenes (strain ATCC 35417 / DSM 20613 / JCM 6297 / CCUG 15421 / P 36-108) TaxID=693979 RepID=E6SNG2_BACT6|nr:hypothetical protein [Bacteroides helcogenes]ADV42755.1 hypothetical protein Bache_0733 [Bacteroides helcogenes P 36-108]MDY5239587.1 hypothetical protein [Bacteroides helcogenes]
MNVIFLLLFLFFFSNCNNSRINCVLKCAGENALELEKVLIHYQDSSLKLEAAKFLIENMMEKSSIEYFFIDSLQRQVSLDTLSFKDMSLFEAYLRRGHFVQKKTLPDVQCITADYLIENIDLAFEARKRYPWCAQLSFSEFCRKVLPYRIGQEPLDRWRSKYFKQYRQLADSLAAHKVQMEDVVFWINKLSNKKYIHEMSCYSGNMSVDVIEHYGGGTCTDLALNAVQVMRSIGIPLNLDIIPYHGKVNGGHAYNSFIDSKGRFTYFSPYERRPERKKWIAPLVQRVNYEYNQMNIPQRQWNKLLTSPTLENVTSQYFHVTDIKVPATYLATFNRGHFNIIAQSTVHNGETVFSQITCGLLYFPFNEKNGKLVATSNPFILNGFGEVCYITIKEEPIQIINIGLYDVKRKIKLENSVYKLYYWNNDWIKISEALPKDSVTINFGEIDRKGLFLIRGKNFMEKMQRPFIVGDKGVEFY